MIVILTKEDCHCDLVSFYENVARKAGLKFTEDSVFDCRKLLITKMVQHEICNYYREQKVEEINIGVMLAQYGPKASLNPDRNTPYRAEVLEGLVNEYPKAEV